MADPKLYSIAPKKMNEPIIWAVDNAWFDSYGPTALSLDFILKQKLKRGISNAETLYDLKDIIEAGQLKGISIGDLEYLYTLVSLCLHNNLQLGLCSFDCFRTKFSRLNQPGSAILLDVNCPSSHSGDYPPDGYGVYLLHEVLEGARPQADIFLVTGYDEVSRELIKTKRYETTWWPLSGIQIVDKSDARLKDSLEAFVRYFLQGLERDPFIKLARGLIKARERGNTHPTSLERLLESTRGLPLAESFVRVEREKPTQGQTSFKSLYHFRGLGDGEVEKSDTAEPTKPSESSIESEFPFGEDRIASEIFVDHCNFLGVELNVENDGEFYLPIQPGLVFVLYFCAFVRALDEKPAVQLSCVKHQGGGRCKLFVPLKDTDGLRAAVYGSETLGEVTLWFKRTLTGRAEWINVLAKAAGVNRHIPWRGPQPLGRTYRLIIQPAFTEFGIELVWEWPKHD